MAKWWPIFDDMQLLSETKTTYSLLPTEAETGYGRIQELFDTQYRREHGVTIEQQVIGGQFLLDRPDEVQSRELTNGNEVAYLDGVQDSMCGFINGFYAVRGELTGRNRDGILHHIVFSYKSPVIHDDAQKDPTLVGLPVEAVVTRSKL